jgi:hypothetical protein
MTKNEQATTVSHAWLTTQQVRKMKEFDKRKNRLVV